ncbi:MAG: curli-like amyloid fiber formation chaperone CsgH [bacterium]
MRWQGLLKFLVIACFVYSLLLYGGVGILAFSALVQTQEYEAWLETKTDNSRLEIKAYCRNNTSEDCVLRYNLKARKKGKAGTTFSSQSGSVYLRSQEEKCLSELGLGVSPKDEYEIKLEVYKDGKLIAEDSLFFLLDKNF